MIERPTRWRLLLGEAAEEQLGTSLSRAERDMDRALAALYEPGEADGDGPAAERGLGSSAPRVARWLGDIRTYFPTSVVQVMQRDAIERLHLTSMLLEPELLDSVQPDVHLASTLVSLNRVMPETTRRTARLVVGKVVAEIEKRIASRTRRRSTERSAGRPAPAAPDRATSTGTPPSGATSRTTCPEHRTVVPDRLVGYGRSAQAVGKDVIVAIDQSGSMAESVVYAAVFGATLASIRSVRTSLIAFDTEIVDLTDQLTDPVDVLFGCQLGGGTDINRAIAYAQQLVTRPTESILVLISDLYEGGIATSCCAGSPSCSARRDGDRAAGAVGLRCARLRPRSRRRPRRAGRPGLRLHPGPVPRPAGRGPRSRRHRPVGGDDRGREGVGLLRARPA